MLELFFCVVYAIYVHQSKNNKIIEIADVIRIIAVFDS